MHGGRTIIVVASIAHVHMHFADLVGDQAPDLLHLCSQRVAIIGISSEALCTDEPSTTTAYRETHLVAVFMLLGRLRDGHARDYTRYSFPHYSTAVIFEASVKAPASRPSRAANASEIIWTGRISSMGCRASQTAGI